ncbi:MAG: 5'/3'-nucleotidase SurE [Deltaproteobacteria bacterium RBG_16_54_11]|nr:MAG: 5'/3'-nucleotidase SurE [Deltaproteobacteria bacterium RBG_16_54_11]
MKILITNDDGVFSEGLRALADTMKALGEVYVVAPDRERSAAAHSLTLHRPLRVEEVAPRVYAADGTPVDCVNLAIYGILKGRPDLVVSGINNGPNLGEDLVYSGTVSAAFEAAFLGIPAFAVSLAAREDFRYQGAANFALKVAAHIMQVGLPKDTFLNINVPNVKEDEIRSYKITHQGKRVFEDAVVEKVDPRGKKYYWIGGGDQGFQEIAGTDFHAVANHYISITPLCVDLTNRSAVPELEGWRL